jgi:hypothetical protein
MAGAIRIGDDAAGGRELKVSGWEDRTWARLNTLTKLAGGTGSTNRSTTTSQSR